MGATAGTRCGGRTRGARALVTVAVLVGAAGCGGYESGGGSESQSESGGGSESQSESGGGSESQSESGSGSSKGDDSAFLACRSFRDLASQVSDGVLTEREVRDKLREVYDDARISETTGIAQSAKKMLRVITEQGYEAPELAAAVRSMSRACTKAGE
jgi:hypothetical protein